MRTSRRSTRLAAVITAAITAVSSVLATTGTAHAADVALPGVEDNRVSVRVDDPIPGKIWPLEIGQSCAGALVPPHALPAVASDVIPMLDGDILDIIRGLGDLNDAVTVLLLAGTLLPATLPGVAGTLAADDVRDDFYLVPVVCAGGRDDAPMETNLFLTQVGSPLGAFEGSVTGSAGGSGSAEGSSIGLGSAELGVGSADGMVELGSASGSDQGSVLGAGFHGSVADVASAGVDVDLGVGSTGSGAGSVVGRGSLERGSTAELDTSSLTSSVELPAGSSNGSSIDVGSVIPVATDVAGSIGDLSFPGS